MSAVLTIAPSLEAEIAVQERRGKHARESFGEKSLSKESWPSIWI
jgi:hypothetical protein